MPSMFASHGRGGAGNITPASDHPKLTHHDLETPTIKSSIFTTGRGGTGNMAHNDNPVETRQWQDVEPVPRRSSSGTTQHWGRGGAGNVFTEEEAEAARTSIAVDGSVIDDSRHSSDSQGFAAKGKKWLLGRKY